MGWHSSGPTFGDAAEPVPNLIWDIKLQKEAKIGSGNTVVTDYIAGKHYQDDGTGSGSKLQFFQHAEGRIVVDGSSFGYEYNLTDHLGNVRVTVAQNGSVVQRDDYYPFGLTFNSYTSTVPENQYKFNGNEVQVEIPNIADFNARFYDASLGRFMNIDPLADFIPSITPYHFSFNNPVVLNDPSGLMPQSTTSLVQDLWNSTPEGGSKTWKNPDSEKGNEGANVLLILNQDKKNWDVEKMKENNPNWTIVVANNLSNGVKKVKKAIGDRKIANLYLSHHGDKNALTYIYNATFGVGTGIDGNSISVYLEDNDNISLPAQKYLQALQEISSMMDKGGFLCFSACRSGDPHGKDYPLSKGLQDLLLDKNDFNIFLPFGQTIYFDSNKGATYPFDTNISAENSFDGWVIINRRGIAREKEIDIQLRRTGMPIKFVPRVKKSFFESLFNK